MSHVKGKRLAFAGRFRLATTSEYTIKARNRGAIVYKDLLEVPRADYLVVGQCPGDALPERAAHQKIPIIDEMQFRNLLFYGTEPPSAAKTRALQGLPILSNPANEAFFFYGEPEEGPTFWDTLLEGLKKAKARRVFSPRKATRIAVAGCTISDARKALFPEGEVTSNGLFSIAGQVKGDLIRRGFLPDDRPVPSEGEPVFASPGPHKLYDKEGLNRTPGVKRYCVRKAAFRFLETHKSFMGAVGGGAGKSWYTIIKKGLEAAGLERFNVVGKDAPIPKIAIVSDAPHPDAETEAHAQRCRVRIHWKDALAWLKEKAKTDAAVARAISPKHSAVSSTPLPAKTYVTCAGCADRLSPDQVGGPNGVCMACEALDRVCGKGAKWDDRNTREMFRHLYRKLVEAMPDGFQDEED